MPTLAYVTSSIVTVINTTSNTVIDTIVAGSYPTGIAITPDSNFVYVTNIFTNDVSVINACDNTVIKNIPVGEFPNSVAITPNGKFAYVANTFSDTVSVINTATLTVVATVHVGHFPEGVAISLNSNLAYVTNTMSNTVSVIDTRTNTVTDTISVGAYPVSIAISSDNLIYVCIQGSNAINGNITVIDFYTNRVVDIIPLKGIPTGLAITPDGKYVYVTNGNLNTVDKIFTGSDTVVASVEVGIFPEGVAITPDGNFVYVANLGSNNISVINTDSNAVVDIIPVLECTNVAIAYIPPCPTPSDRMCIETTRIFDACMFEEQQRKTFKIPNLIVGQDIQCEILETEYRILDVTIIDKQTGLADVKLQIKVFVRFTSKCSDDDGIKKVVCFDKNVALIVPEGADVGCTINNAVCECIQTRGESCHPDSFDKICCTVKVAALVKSKKLIQIEVPVLRSCEPKQCYTKYRLT